MPYHKDIMIVAAHYLRNHRTCYLASYIVYAFANVLTIHLRVKLYYDSQSVYIYVHVKQIEFWLGVDSRNIRAYCITYI